MKRLPAILCFFLAILFASPGQGQGTNPGSKRWKELIRLINQEVKTITRVRNMGPDLKYRLLELYTQKAKLIKEYENQKFLTTSFKIRKGRPKKSFFKKSRAQFQETLKLGRSIIKSHPNYYRIGDIYYTMALNSRDFGDTRYLESYMKKALRYSPKRSKIVHNIHVALAEYFYNEKRYKEGIYHYGIVLRNKNDQWYPKHLYNLSWCYLKTQQMKKAVYYNKKSYFASRKKRYVDISEQALESIGVFHILGRQVPEGVKFYEENVENPIRFLLRMAEKASDSLGFKYVQYILSRSTMIAAKRNLNKEKIDILLAKLDAYRTFKQYGLHYKTSLAFYRQSKKQKIGKSYLDEGIKKISSLAGYLQLRLSKDMKKGSKNYNPKELKLVQSYFLVLGRLDPQNSDQYRYYQGETYFSVAEYSKALRSYSIALKRSKKLPGKRLEKKDKILKSLLGTLQIARLPKPTMDKYTIFTYTNYLVIYPRGEKSQSIYEKLFNLYFAKRAFDQAVAVLDTYKQYYPKRIKTQREMLTRVIDKHIEDKNTDRLVFWIKKLETGYLSFDASYIKKAQTVLGYILFEKYQIQEKNDKRGAIAGYQELFENEEYPRNIRARTAFKMSLLYLDLAETKTSYEWMNQALNLFTINEIGEINTQIFTMSEQFYLMQDFENSANLSNSMLQRFCQRKIKHKTTYFENAVRFRLVNSDERDALNSFRLGKRCSIPRSTIENLAKAMLVHFAENRQINNLVGFYRENATLGGIKEPYILALLNEYWAHKFEQKQRAVKQIGRAMVAFTQKNQGRIPAATLNDVDLTLNFERFEQKAQDFLGRSLATGTEFNEALYNQKLESLVVELKNLRDESQVFTKNGTVEVVLGSYKLLSKNYAHLAAIINEVNPSNRPVQFQKEFKSQMNLLTTNLLAESRNFKQMGVNIIQENEVLTPYNRFFYQSERINSLVRMEYPASFLLNTIDTMEGLP